MPTRKRKNGSAPPKPLRCAASPLTLRSNCCNVEPLADWLGVVQFDLPLIQVWENEYCGFSNYGTTSGDTPTRKGQSPYGPGFVETHRFSTSLGLAAHPGSDAAELDFLINGPWSNYADVVFQPCGGSKWALKPGLQATGYYMPLCYYQGSGRVYGRGRATLYQIRQWAPDGLFASAQECCAVYPNSPPSSPVLLSSLIDPWQPYQAFYDPAAPPPNVDRLWVNPYARGFVSFEVRVAGTYATFADFTAAASANIEGASLRWFFPPLIRSGISNYVRRPGTFTCSFDETIREQSLSVSSSGADVVYFEAPAIASAYHVSGWNHVASLIPGQVYCANDTTADVGDLNGDTSGTYAPATAVVTWDDEEPAP